MHELDECVVAIWQSNMAWRMKAFALFVFGDNFRGSSGALYLLSDMAEYLEVIGE